MKNLVSTFWRRLRPVVNPNQIYSRAFPSEQTAADLFRGEWTCRVPLPGLAAGLRTGALDLFHSDGRPAWFAKAMGEMRGKRVLELGPLEAAHTYQLEQFGADVTAIESNIYAFQRCLIVKNTLGLRAKFLLGDFVPYLQKSTERFDAIFASGVLYHMQNPVEVLRDLCRLSDHLYLWTHYYDRAALEKNPDAWRTFSSATERQVGLGTQSSDTVSYHERVYASKFLTYFVPGFCGGMHTKTYWMKLEDIMRCLNAFDFEVLAHETDPTHANGPCVSLYARRRVSA